MYAEKPKPINKYLQATDAEIAEVEMVGSSRNFMMVSKA